MFGTKQADGRQNNPVAAKSLDTADSGANHPTTSRQQILQLLLINRTRKPDEPVSVDDLLEMAARELESLFQTLPLGPIPEYLHPHYFVHQCVAEYEDRLEALDRWKARQLCKWLETNIGLEIMIDGKTYQLQTAQSSEGGIDRFWFEIITPSSV